MSDTYEVLLALDVHGDLGAEELAELRWHLGQGPLPERLPMGTDQYLPTFPLGDPDDPACQWETAAPEPLFAQDGPARHIGGVLVSVMAERDTPRSWSLTVRQELHPDEFHALRAFLYWLGRHSTHAADGGEHHIGHLRFHESAVAVPLLLADGTVALPEGITAHTPHWQPPQG